MTKSSDKEKVYEKGKWGFRVGWGERPAILVIDLQYFETDPSSPLGSERLSPVVENTKQLLDKARKKQIPIVFVTTQFRADGADLNGWHTKKVPMLHKWQVEGTRWTQIDKRLQPQKRDIYVVKKVADSFFATDLDFVLRNLGIDTVIFTGCSTSSCIRAAVEHALFLEYRNIVPKECVGDRSEEAHQFHLFDMDNRYADVVTMSEVIDHIKKMPKTDYRPLWRQALARDISVQEIEEFAEQHAVSMGG